MNHRQALIGLLTGQALIGSTTTQLIPGVSATGEIGWTLYLIVLPIALANLIWIAWPWTAMACVIYATVGLALDLATIMNLLSETNVVGVLLFISIISGIMNSLLIRFGGRAFLSSFGGTVLSKSHPPSPQSHF